MATYTVSQTKNILLTPNQVDTITFTGTGTEFMFFQSGGTPVYFTTAPLGETPVTPSTLGDNNYSFVAANGTVKIPWNGSGLVIKCVTTGSLASCNFALI